jgi:hypothetical protein
VKIKNGLFENKKGEGAKGGGGEKSRGYEFHPEGYNNIADIPRYMKLPAQDGGNINAVCSNSQKKCHYSR